MDNMIRRDRCVACGATGEELYSDLSDKIFDVGGTWSHRQCPSCDLAWLDPQPRPDEIWKLYENYWTHGDGTVPVPNANHSTSRKRAVRKVIGTILPWRRHAMRSDQRYLEDMKPGRLVDVGCGMGEYAAGMAQLGWEVEAIDFDAGALAVAAGQPGIVTAHGSLIDQKYPDGRFDAVVMSNVIEHIPDQPETFAECYRVLRGGGRLVIITPNIQSKGHNIFGPDWRGLEVPRHLFLHSPASLKKLAKEAGFGKVTVFTAAGLVEDMLRESNTIAERSGRKQHQHLNRIARSEKLETLFGKHSGEWVILKATK